MNQLPQFNDAMNQSVELSEKHQKRSFGLEIYKHTALKTKECHIVY